MEDALRELAERPADRGAHRYWGTRIVGLLALFQFVALGFAAALWWWAMPKGFPILHPRFAMNIGIPVCFVALTFSAIYACVLSRHRLLYWCQLTMLVSVLTAGITGSALFPSSMSGFRLLTVVAVPVIVVVTVTGLVHRFMPRTPIRATTLLPAIVLGVFIPWSQRGMVPATIPVGRQQRPDAVALPSSVNPVDAKWDKRFEIHPFAGVVTARNENLSLEINPILTFKSTSPDRFWTLFSPEHPRQIRLIDSRSWTNGFAADFTSEVRSHLELQMLNEILEINATAELDRPIYSHLNHYTGLLLFGSQLPSIVFSPCPEQIDVLPSDYPIGRPARFACLKPNGRFEVLEARSGEKGPFKTLAAGELSRGEPLVITLFEGIRPVFELELRDWSAQASTQLSPTAGWGMPENAIEFSRGESGNLAMLNITLAGTSVGRGWDSVGHAPGTYANRMKVRVLSAK